MGRTEKSRRLPSSSVCAYGHAERVSGISQEVLGQRAGLSTPYISSVERGERNVSLFNILRLADALESDASRLVKSLPSPPDRGRY